MRMTATGAGSAHIHPRSTRHGHAPDTMRKSRQEKSPPPKREQAHPGKLSNPRAGDKAEKRQGGA